MSVDAMARSAGQATREDVTSTLDVDAKLRELNVTRARRRRTTGAATLLAGCAAAALVAAVLPRGLVEESDGAAGQVQGCLDYPQVRCANEVVTVPGPTSYTFSVPHGFSREVDLGAAPATVEVGRTDVPRGGLSILEDVRAAGQPQIRGAEPLARWVASRPFLESSPVRRDTLDGFDSWTVLVRLGPGAPGSKTCNGAQTSCRAVLEQPERGGWQTGVWDGMASRYTFVDVPGLGTVAVWSWIFDAPPRFGDDDALMRSIDFDVPRIPS